MRHVHTHIHIHTHIYTHIYSFSRFTILHIFQVVLNLNDAKDIVEPFAIYIAQLIHLFLQFWPAQFLLDYSILPYESM